MSPWLLTSVWVMLATGTLLAFAGVVHNGFIGYDDDAMIFGNPRITEGLTRSGVAYALTGPHGGNWHPLTTLSHQLDCELFGVERPGGHHGVSLLLHTLSVLLLFEALRRMTHALWPSALVAALFAIHPLRVESIAWGAERKDVLGALFWMLTLLAYSAYVRRPGWRRYLLVSLAFGLGLLSKPMLVTLPCVLLLLDVWPLRRWRPADVAGDAAETLIPQQHAWPARRLILEKIPWLLAAVAVGVATIIVQRQDGVIHPSMETLPIAWRLINSVNAYVFYLKKTVWPIDLAILYPHPGLAQSAQIQAWIAPAIGATAFLVLTTLAAVLNSKRRPYLIVGWLWYLGTLAPVIGLFQVGFQAYADRYTYIPMVGIYIAVVWLLRDLVAWSLRDLPARSVAVRGALFGAAGAVLVLLAARSWHQVGYWRDSQTLFRHTLRITSDNFYIQNNLGNDYAGRGEYGQAAHHLRAAIEANPRFSPAHNNLGDVLLRLGDLASAEHHFRRAIELDPASATAVNNLGNVYLRREEWKTAGEHYRHAIQIEPNYAEAHCNYGNILLRTERLPAAIEEYELAIRLNPRLAVPYFNLGNIHLDKNELTQAAAYYRQALEQNPNYIGAHVNLANVLIRQKDTQAAVQHYRQAALADPNSAPIHFALGMALLEREEWEEAAKAFAAAVALDPGSFDAQIRLAMAMARQGDLNAATQHYQRALRIRPHDPEAYCGLGQVCLTRNDLECAETQFIQAIRVAPHRADAHWGLGSVRLRQGRADAARAAFKEALRIEPGHMEAQRLLRSLEQPPPTGGS